MVNEMQKDFVKLLEGVAGRYPIMDVFGDFCAASACACEQLTFRVAEREQRYHSVMARYDAGEFRTFARMLSIVAEALELRRQSFLGPVLEEIGAANTRNGQFLTPVAVANLMARTSCEQAAAKHRPGELVRIGDPACGAGVLLISQAEEMVRAGVPQRDVYVIGGDIDMRACDIAFVELTLLGYAARIEHKDALANRDLSRPRWTAGYYIYGTQWRENFQHQKKEM